MKLTPNPGPRDSSTKRQKVMMKMGAKVILHFSGLCLVSTSYDIPLYHFTENACAYMYVSLSYKILFAKKEKKKKMGVLCLV